MPADRFTLRRVQFRATPEPDEPQRAAIAEALRDLSVYGHPVYRSAWRRAALEHESDDDYAVALPRSSRGATWA